MNLLTNCWRLMRPRQWIKNGFVLMGTLFANAWRQPGMLQRVLMATAAFSLIASGVYVLNDILDRKDDAHHPAKKLRPLAAGTVSVRGLRGVRRDFSAARPSRWVMLSSSSWSTRPMDSRT